MEHLEDGPAGPSDLSGAVSHDELLGETDGMTWAETFVKTLNQKSPGERAAFVADASTMAAWFASAVTAGVTYAQKQAAERAEVKIIRCGWFAFEGFGGPYEGWAPNGFGGYDTAGRSVTYKGALKKALALQKKPRVGQSMPMGQTGQKLPGRHV